VVIDFIALLLILEVLYVYLVQEESSDLDEVKVTQIEVFVPLVHYEWIIHEIVEALYFNFRNHLELSTQVKLLTNHSLERLLSNTCWMIKTFVYSNCRATNYIHRSLQYIDVSTTNST
jgi:hypothetical protein